MDILVLGFGGEMDGLALRSCYKAIGGGGDFDRNVGTLFGDPGEIEFIEFLAFLRNITF